MFAICVRGFVQPGDTNGMGRWQGDDLEGTASRNNGLGVDAELPDALRFKRNVGGLVLKRRKIAGAEGKTDSIAVFLLRPLPPSGIEAEREPFLGEGQVEIVGQIWLCNA